VAARKIAARETPTTGPAPAGEGPELARIYDAFHGRVLAYAAKLFGADEAEDLAQEVFIKVGRSLGSLSDPAKLAPWIYTITLNTVRDAARRRASDAGRRCGAEASPSDDPEAESPIARLPDPSGRDPEETAIRNEMLACYLDYVRRLPPSYAEVYVLKEFEGLGNEAIARRLGLSLATVKIRLHRARARLHDQLRRNCRCYYNERGELMGEPKP
jgi:RNA polymerase sigma-70 factor (ECF subfamily)